MPSYLRKILLIVLLLIASTGIMAFMAMKQLSGQLQKALVSAAAANGATLQFESFQAGISGLTANGLSLAYLRQKLPLTLQIDTLSIAPAWLTLSSGLFEFKLTGRLYDGKLTGSGKYDLNAGTLSGNLTLENLDASRHTALRTLGVSAGLLSFQLPAFSLSGLKEQRPALETASFRLAVTGLSRPAQLFNLASFLPVALPAFNDLNLELECEGRKLDLSCARIESSSNLGTFNGKGGISKSGPEGSIELSADISLSHDGQKAFGSFLPLLSGGKVPATQGIFALQLNGPLSRPNWSMTGY